MAETPFPVPRTTVFNPDAWGSSTPISEDEIAFLGNHFVTFPTTQSNVTFPVSPTVPTLAIATNDTRAASAQFVQNAKNTQTWGALQTFNAGMVASTIDPLTDGGTLTIGNSSANNVVNIMTASNNGTLSLGSSGSTTRLNVPLTPNYTYPVAAGKIGQFITGTNTSLGVTANTPKTISSIDLPEGIWIIYGQIQGAGNSIFFTLAFSTTTNSITTGVVAIDSCPVAGTGPAQTLTYPVLVPAPVSPATTTTYYFVACVGTNQTLFNCVFLASRIA